MQTFVRASFLFAIFFDVHIELHRFFYHGNTGNIGGKNWEV